MAENNHSVVSQDGALRVTLTAFDPARGKGQVKVEELVQKRGWFYITIKFGAGGQHRIDYKTWDVNKASAFEVSTSVRNDRVSAIEIVRVPESSS
jgi:hypothetical protein